MEKNTKDNHFNPKGYLKGFSNAEKQLIRYDKSIGRYSKPRHYSSWGYEKYLYVGTYRQVTITMIDIIN